MKLKKTILRIRNETNCSFLKDSKILKLFFPNACIIQKDFVPLHKEIKSIYAQNTQHQTSSNSRLSGRDDCSWMFRTVVQADVEETLHH